MMNKLQQYFPMIKTRQEIMDEINDCRKLKELYHTWNEEQREEFLDFCTGVRGVKILTVLPNDGTRLADESSLLIMHIVVKLEDGSICNVEAQKVGYKFPGQRSACYSADLLLRQYKRVRSTMKKKFSYKEIKNVYIIVLFEKSPREFHAYPNIWIHKFEQFSDTGLELDLMQKFVFIPLDIFRENHYNKTIENKLDAWLAFLCMDSPDMVISISEAYPEFKAMYEQVYDICRNVEDVMGLFSKELQELDRNTVQLMIDEMQEELNQKKEELNRQKAALEEKDRALEEKDQTLEEKDRALEEKEQALEEKDRALEEKEQEYQDALRRLRELENREG